MLQVSIIREEKEKVIRGLNKRRLKHIDGVIDQILSLDLKRRQTQQQQDGLLGEANVLAREIGSLMKNGKKDEAEALKSRTADMKKTIAELGQELAKTEQELQKVLYTLPNIPSEMVPEGGGADDNKTV